MPWWYSDRSNYNLEDFGITETTKLMNTIYDTKEVADMRISIFIVLPKKPGTTDCA